MLEGIGVGEERLQLAKGFALDIPETRAVE